MYVKWIVTDMDGTLLNSRDQISEKTRAALLACQEKGIRLILASGRSYIRQMPYAEQLRLAEFGGAMIEVNGLAVNRLQNGGREVFERLGREDKELLFSELQRFEVEIHGYQDEALYYWIPDWQRPFKEQERKEKGYPPEHPLVAGPWSWVTSNVHSYPTMKEIFSGKEMPDELNKMGCSDRPERIPEVYEYLKEHFEKRYEIARTDSRSIEISRKGISKGNALKRLMEEEGVRPEEVLAFGDGENDISLFRAVSHSIAMGNAEDYVKEHATDVTGTNNEDGIVMALEKYGVL